MQEEKVKFRLDGLKIVGSMEELASIPQGKALINTINAHSYNVARKDADFAAALRGGDYLIPDGMSIVHACRFLRGASRPKERIAGWDLFEDEMMRLSVKGGKVMFVGSSESVLERIRERCSMDYPCLKVETYSPPYRKEFSEEDNADIIGRINAAKPDLLWIGMTAPKQEKWTYANWDKLDVDCHVGTIGAVFDFYAGTIHRAPKFMQEIGLEWLYRLVMEPKRLWRRYVLGNFQFIFSIIGEKLHHEL